MQVFDYSSLSSQKNQIVQGFHDKGIIGIRGVPGFVKAYEDFLGSSEVLLILQKTRSKIYCPRRLWDGVGLMGLKLLTM